MGKSLFIDAEWFLNQRIYLIGYAYTLERTHQLYGRTLTIGHWKEVLKGVSVIYCYGPDIGMLEKFFDMDLRNTYICFNLLGIMRKLEPNLPNYKLSTLEILAGIHRETMQYKTNIWQLHRDWMNPDKRKLALQYNCDDVHNMIQVKHFFFRRHLVYRKNIMQYRMK